MKKLSIAFVCILLIILIGLSLRASLIKEEKKPPTLVPVKWIGSFSLQKQDDKAKALVGERTPLTIKGASEGRSIVGYDLVLIYDGEDLDINQTTSLLSDFDIYPFKKSNSYLITGVKKLSSNTPLILADTPVVEIIVIPKRSGDITIRLVSRFNRQTTQMVDEFTNILNPKVDSITLNIQ